MSGERRMALLLLAAGVAAGVGAFAAADDPAYRPWPVLGAWMLANACVLGAALVLDRSARRRSRAVPRIGRWEAVAAGAVVVTALALRAVALDSVPGTVSGDEGEMGNEARKVLSGEIENPFVTGWFSHPTLWFFVQAGSLRLFGDDIAGLRMVSALIGAATVGALYLFSRIAFGRTAALAAAALLATYHVHVHYSRLALNNVVDPLPVLLAFAALLHGVRTRSWLGFAAAGVCLGVAQHFYMGARVAPLVAVAVLAHLLLVDPARLRGLAGRIGLAALGFVMGMGPLLTFLASHLSDFNARVRLVGLFQSGDFERRRLAGEGAVEILLEQARRGFGAFTTVPDRSEFYDPGMPLLDTGSAALLVVGLVILAAQWRRSGSVLVLAWLAGGALLGGALLVDPPHSPRYVTLAPAVCLVVALALEWFGRLVGRLGGGVRGARAVVAGGTCAVAAWSTAFYFGEYTPREHFAGARTEAATAIGRYLGDMPRETHVYLLAAPATYLSNGSITFLAPGVTGTDVVERLTSSHEVPTEQPLRVYVALPDRAGELAHAREGMPGGRVHIGVSRADGRPLFYAYEPPGFRRREPIARVDDTVIPP